MRNYLPITTLILAVLLLSYVSDALAVSSKGRVEAEIINPKKLSKKEFLLFCLHNHTNRHCKFIAVEDKDRITPIYDDSKYIYSIDEPINIE